ncbi:MAG TPA: type II toxin-antitoxin system death-on-curing family toxin [Caulobacteraceae bacterium]
MPSEFLWPTPEEAIAINRAVVADTGEPFGLLDENRLASALASARNHWAYEQEDDAITLAVILLLAVARNHPFRQGNKRTALAIAYNFLNNAGHDLVGPNSTDLADAIVGALTGELGQGELEDRVRSQAVPFA